MEGIITQGEDGKAPPTGLVVDRAKLLARMEGDEELMLELVEIFLDDCPKLMGDIGVSVDEADALKLERAAHALKGAVGNFAAQAAYDAALRLERMGREGDLAELETAWTLLQQEMERLKPALSELGAE